MAENQIKSVRWWHEEIVSLMIARPDWRQYQMAQYFGVTEAWLSQIINSDVFQAYKAERLARHHENVSTTTIERVEDLANSCLDKLTDRIEALGDDFAIGPVRETCEMALKSLGYGPRGGGGNQPVQINIGVDRGLLESARNDMRRLQAQPADTPAIEGEFSHVKTEESEREPEPNY